MIPAVFFTRAGGASWEQICTKALFFPKPSGLSPTPLFFIVLTRKSG